MPKRPIFKLTKDAQGNHVPMVGVVSAAYWNRSETAKEKNWPAQLKVLGTWEGLGEGDLYLPLRIVGDMVDKGFLQDEAQGEGEPDRYRVLMPNTRVQLLKEKGEGDREYVRFSLVDGSQPPQEPPESTKPSDPKKTTKPKLKDVIGDVKGFHMGCLALSAHNFVTLFTIPVENLSHDAVHAGAYTIAAWLQQAGIRTFTEKQLDNIREAMEQASYTARNATQFPEDIA